MRKWPFRPLVALLLVATVILPSSARADLLQTITLTCNDGTKLNLTLSTTALNALTNAVKAMTLYPAGNPALSCSLSTPTLADEPEADLVAADTSSGPQELAVGGGQTMFSAAANCEQNVNSDAHAPVSSAPVPASGHVNLSIPPGVCSHNTGDMDTQVDCMQVNGNTADITSTVTGVDGFYASIPGYTVGQEVGWHIVDLDATNSGAYDQIAGDFTSAQCAFLTSKQVGQSTFTLNHGDLSVGNSD